MTKILVFVDSFSVGGVTSVVKNIYENIDKTKFKMDFVSFGPLDDEYIKRINENGDKVYFIAPPLLNKIPILNYAIRRFKVVKMICKAVKKGEYDAAHIHANAYACVPAAKKLKIPVRIMHVHEAVQDFNGNAEKSFITKLIWNYRVKMYNRLATVKAGDSPKACRAKFGEEVMKDSKMVVIYPSVDKEKFNPKAYKDSTIARELKISDENFNLIHVGRLSAVKNQKFIIDIVGEMNKKKPTMLYIVGEGEMKEELKKYAIEKGIENKVIFLPHNTSPAIYNYMNASVLPSFSEAFGMVAVESQFMNVPCFASANVPQDVDCGMCTFISLDKGAKEWADKIICYDYENMCCDESVKNKFDIKYIVENLQNTYSGKL